jgi:hypothetical protein
MLRPIYLDLLDVLLPLAVATAALVAGWRVRRLPGVVMCTVIGVAVLIVGTLGVGYFVPFPEPVNEVLWHVGGETTIACVIAMLLLGVVWASQGRSTSTGFLRALVGVVFLIMVLTTGGRLWWRAISRASWDNTPSADGCLMQSSGWTCSPATAAMLLHQHGIVTSEGEMAYLAGTSYLGTDVRSIASALRTKARPHHLTAHVMHGDAELCLRRPGPFLACIRVPQLGGHAVLVLRATDAEVELIDPRFGQREKVVRSQIEKQWDGKITYLKRAN